MPQDDAWNGLRTIADKLSTSNYSGKTVNIVDALFMIADSIKHLGDSIVEAEKIREKRDIK